MMVEKSRKFLLRASPLLGVCFFLLMLNLIVSPQFLWALIPIAAMSIPLFTIFAHTFLGDEKDQAADMAREQYRELRRAERDERRAERRGETLAMPVAQAAPQAIVLDRSLEQQLAQVKTYRQAIDNLARNSPASRKQQLAELSGRFGEWEKSVQQMAERITTFRSNGVVQQDLRTVPDSIRKLEDQLKTEKDDIVRAQLERTLNTRRNQLVALEKLQATMRHSEIQLESAVASLGTIYSQALANQSTNTIADYAGLATDVDDQVRALQDQLEVLEEVRLGRASGNLQ